MSSIVVNHVPSDLNDMLGGAINSDSVYSFAQPMDTHSTSSNPPTSTAPPSVGSARLPVHANDVPAYINSYTPSQASRASSDTPNFTPRPPSMTSHPNHALPPDSYSSAPTPPTQSGSNSYSSDPSAPDSPRLQPTYQSMQSVPGSEANSPSRIRVQSLSHIQSLANENLMGSWSSHNPAIGPQQRQYEISSMPVTEIIEMVAGLLTKITTTNDMHHEHVHRHIPPPEGTSNLSPQATSVLAFHGKNVPTITILSYLTRIHKYCPTTYEVFLSLLVYFDRMTELVNRDQLEQLHQLRGSAEESGFSSTSTESPGAHQMQDSHLATPPPSTGFTAQDPQGSTISPSLSPQSDAEELSHFFVVDSFNIHRLVIAAVTCASKFFSDVFYTNSRYAKVGGLPLVELNHLELQFLLLNDFRLAITVEELESYGTMLVEFYAREVVTQRQQKHRSLPRAIGPPATDAYSDAMYMRSRDKPRGHVEFGQTPTPP
ncbi:Cyclin-dependent protein kinase complex component, putative [Penicillium digitatum]|uniref:Cyclin-dependent protein kinase complex component, putative n=2 Tax=Penicillium digitatum TaxID=36651 RepID=K9G851_PEND1|nr:Cyclin-dependent protein kinase complex component, putative [Penicillium digitatum Pd1]EKV10983.1 Cyclin-dependent protein kinase complex component, putative [Penicillium digitatum Pd1]QQK43997.1 Cyclin-dependent protein kinase complex component, putative [Penicillium digitatum]